MKPIQVKCPGCGKAYAVSNPASVGKNTKCKVCNTTFLIQASEESEEEAAAPQPVAARGAAPAGRAKAAAPAAPPPAPKKAPAGDGGDDEDEEEGEDYPDNEPTISVSAFEAQKLREQLKQGLLNPQGAAPQAGAEPGNDGGEDDIPQPVAKKKPAPKAAPAKAAGGSSAMIYVIVGLVVLVAGLAGAFFMFKK